MNTNDEAQPLETYRDSPLQWKRTVYLFPDRVRIIARKWQTDTDATVPLNILTPQRVVVRYRNSAFRAGAILCAVGAVLSMLMITIMLATHWVWVLAVIPPALAITGLIVAIKAARKTTTVIFKTGAGVAGMSISNVGPDRDRFEAFVARVTEAIQNAQDPQTSEQSEVTHGD